VCSNITFWINANISTCTMKVPGTVRDYVDALTGFHDLLEQRGGSVSLEEMHRHFFSGLPEHLQVAYDELDSNRQYLVPPQGPVNEMVLSRHGQLLNHLQRTHEAFTAELQRKSKNEREHKAAVNAITVRLNAIATTPTPTPAPKRTKVSWQERTMKKYNLTRKQFDDRLAAKECFQCGQLGHRPPNCGSPNGNAQ
jgi:hypothetical protein